MYKLTLKIRYQEACFEFHTMNSLAKFIDGIVRHYKDDEEVAFHITYEEAKGEEDGSAVSISK